MAKKAKKVKRITIPRTYNPPGKDTPVETLAYISPAERRMLLGATDLRANRAPGGLLSYYMETDEGYQGGTTGIGTSSGGFSSPGAVSGSTGARGPTGPTGAPSRTGSDQPAGSASTSGVSGGRPGGTGGQNTGQGGSGSGAGGNMGTRGGVQANAGGGRSNQPGSSLGGGGGRDIAQQGPSGGPRGPTGPQGQETGFNVARDAAAAISRSMPQAGLSSPGGALLSNAPKIGDRQLTAPKSDMLHDDISRGVIGAQTIPGATPDIQRVIDAYTEYGKTRYENDPTVALSNALGEITKAELGNMTDIMDPLGVMNFKAAEFADIAPSPFDDGIPTIQDVLDWGDQTISAQKKAYGRTYDASSAIGPYQITTSNIDALANQMGLPLDTPMTGDVYNAMAAKLIQGRIDRREDPLADWDASIGQPKNAASKARAIESINIARNGGLSPTVSETRPTPSDAVSTSPPRPGQEGYDYGFDPLSGIRAPSNIAPSPSNPYNVLSGIRVPSASPAPRAPSVQDMRNEQLAEQRATRPVSTAPMTINPAGVTSTAYNPLSSIRAPVAPGPGYDPLSSVAFNRTPDMIGLSELPDLPADRTPPPKEITDRILPADPRLASNYFEDIASLTSPPPSRKYQDRLTPEEQEQIISVEPLPEDTVKHVADMIAERLDRMVNLSPPTETRQPARTPSSSPSPSIEAEDEFEPGPPVNIGQVPDMSIPSVSGPMYPPDTFAPPNPFLGMAAYAPRRLPNDPRGKQGGQDYWWWA